MGQRRELYIELTNTFSKSQLQYMSSAPRIFKADKANKNAYLATTCRSEQLED